RRARRHEGSSADVPDTGPAPETGRRQVGGGHARRYDDLLYRIVDAVVDEQQVRAVAGDHVRARQQTGSGDVVVLGRSRDRRDRLREQVDPVELVGIRQVEVSIVGVEAEVPGRVLER